MAVTGEQGPPRRGVAPDGGFLLFRVSGIPVLLAPSWWIGSLIIVVLYTPLVGRLLPGATTLTSWLLAAAFAVLLGLSVLAHELGHCLVALRLGIPVRRLRLFLLGGLSEVARTPRQPRHEGLVAAAGPVVSLLLGGFCGLLMFAVPPESAAWLLIAECAVANFAVGIFNLLPGLPLDGGRLVRAGVWAVTGRRDKGTRAAVVGGGLVAAGLVIWALWGLAAGSEDRWLRLGVCVVTAWFVILGARSELAAEARRGWPEGVRLSELVRPVLQLPAESPVSDALAASAGRGVVLVRADGVAAGLLDETAAAQLAGTSPHAPAEMAAEPIRADTVLLSSESGEEIAERVRETAAWQFLVVDDEGRPAGVLRREDLRAAMTRSRPPA
ncbi:site-2 protease family protein [Amycolatopsis regifaucium]|uniref:Zinc metalloprotease n=1 Tax=Amycolatopsis regifaucium TaxID=546365 RepID=A0A154MV08_9PSEU|nr:site-2 protease family protein [Amycolatopsis regifaucium]KZB88111.1 peptidase M50 [Amycolatopsis regifaucium]OKA04386.1 site-2 protease family protein [Amycolatopsis regifaucium]SFH47997.1 Zn-dependent protease (includes SpoIVFB) [Amycolatopsis regifaucium]